MRKSTQRYDAQEEETVPPDIIQLLIDGQTKIFAVLDELRKEVRDIKVQANEISHINKTLDEYGTTLNRHETKIGLLEAASIKQEARGAVAEKSLGKRIVDSCVISVCIGAVMIFVSILGFTLFVNTQAFYDFQHTQISPPDNATHPGPNRSSHGNGQ